MSGDGPKSAGGAPAWQEARFRSTASFPQALHEAGCSLLVSTYQAGKLVGIGVDGSGLSFSFQSFDQAMGVAVARPGVPEVAVGARGQIWFLREDSQIAAAIEPRGRFDRAYLSRRTTVTGPIHCHEVAWGGGAGEEPELWVVNTLFSCLATLDPEYNFVPRWRPPFVSALAAEDRCHLNGVAMREGAPAFVTAMAQTDHPGGWRERKNETGCVIAVGGGEIVSDGLAMPHSPRWHDGKLFVLDSGRGRLESVHLDSGNRATVASLPGYARGLACHGHLAFVGLSRIRETAVFGGLPIAEQRDELICGVGIVDLRTGLTIGTLEFESGVEEIFDVQVLPDTRCPVLSGEDPSRPGAAHQIWVVPSEGTSS